MSREEAVAQAKGEIAGEDALNDKLDALEKEDRINQLLAEMRTEKSDGVIGMVETPAINGQFFPAGLP